MNLGNLGKVNTWVIMELLSLLLMITTATLSVLWITQYVEQEYYLSGYYPIISILALFITSIMKYPMQIRIERVELWKKTKKARSAEGVTKNTKLQYKWAKAPWALFFTMLLLMITTLYFIDTIITAGGAFSSTVPILETLGWFSVIMTLVVGLLLMLITTPTINSPQWVKEKIEP